MTHRNDGGPAFPNVPDGAGDKWTDWDQGMSLRDWFAGQALGAIISVTSAETHQPGMSNQGIASKPIEQRMAFDAYRLSDAMIAAREAEGK